MQDHWFAAFRHAAGLGPHPGEYKGPPRKKRKEGEPTETDMQRAREEPIREEKSAHKMHAAQRGEELGPTQFQEQQARQAWAMQQVATTQGAAQALQAQAGMKPHAPPAPSGAAGVTKPYAAQASPEAVPTTGETPTQPTPSEEESQEQAQ